MSDYGYHKHIKGLDLAEGIDLVTTALKEEGFGILTEIDVKTTLKDKIDVDFRPYTILGACNPTIAHQALEAEPLVGLLLPCNVVVQEQEGGVTISIANPQVMGRLAENQGIISAMNEADARIKRVMQTL